MVPSVEAAGLLPKCGLQENSLGLAGGEVGGCKTGRLPRDVFIFKGVNLPGRTGKLGTWPERTDGQGHFEIRTQQRCHCHCRRI